MSIKAYPPAWAQGDALRAATGQWRRRRLLTPAQQVAIEAAHPAPYYRPNNWIRVVLMGVTLLGVGTGFCLFASVTDFELSPLVYSLLAVLALVAGLERLIKTARHYRSGVDTALLYCALVAWGCFIAYAQRHVLSDSFSSPVLWRWLLPMLLALLVALLRYADPVVAAAAFVAALALLANVLLQSGIGRLLLPFAVMVAAGALLVALRRLPARADYFYYRSAGLVLHTLGLATFYLAGNYLVVREANAELLGGGRPSAEIPLAPLFWAFTAGIPLLYIGLGLRRHHRLPLTMGMLALGFSVFTLRQYHSLLPPEVAATLGGALLLAGALAALRYLRTPRHGFTAGPDDEAGFPLNLETFITAHTAHAPAAPVAGFEFGGGHSGGGGAAGRF